MQTRRHFLKGSAALLAAGGLPACSDDGMAGYEEAAERLRAPLSPHPEAAELIRYATLAANGHNAQPWTFSVAADRIAIRPDASRRTPAVDPDDHHLFVSLGCAAENLRIGACAHGRTAEVDFSGGDGDAVEVGMDRGPAQIDDLYATIPRRQSTRSLYDGRALSAEQLKDLEKAAAIEGVSLRLVTARDGIDAIRDLVVAGNGVQMDDEAFVAELKRFIRFNAADALARADGLFTACTGNPTAPDWLGRLMFDLFFTKASENDKYAEQMRSSAGVAIFVGDRADHDHWVRVGRSFQRFALKATALGLKHSHVNQPVEVPGVRGELAAWLGAASVRPDLVVRFGHGPGLPMSMRRPVGEVMQS